jgi:3D (Asp-Asp-Asp) domain-containing protein
LGQLPMTKAHVRQWKHKAPRTTALAVVVVTMVLVLMSTLGYTAYANHSTISSLKSELSEKEKIIYSKDNLIHDTQVEVEHKDAIIQSHTEVIEKSKQQIEESQHQIESTQKEVEEKAKAIKELEQKLTAKVEAKKEPQLVALSSQSKPIASTNTSPKAVLAKDTSAILVAKGDFESGWRASFYNLGVVSTGKRPGDSGYGVTASGRQVSSVTIAVDTRYVPLGTWVEIKMPDGSIVRKRADDTGSAIKGKKIDIYMNASDSTLNAKGLQNIEVKILGKTSDS